MITVSALLSTHDTPASEPPEHRQHACDSCHDHHQDPPPPTDAVCFDCHAVTLPETDLAAGAFHDPADRACSRCHGYHATGMLKAGGRVFARPFGDEQVLLQCRNCHREDSIVQNVSEGHAVAADQYHVDAVELMGQGPSVICLRCHDRDSMYDQVPDVVPVFPTHGSHPIGVEIPVASPWEASGFRPLIDDSLELVDQQLECSTCHRLPAETTFRLVPFPSATALCNGCHDMAPGGSPAASIVASLVATPGAFRGEPSAADAPPAR